MTAIQDPTAATYLDKTRIAYDVVADGYFDLLRNHMSESIWDRAMLDAFAEMVSGPVVDVGCGPGRATGYLADLEVEVSGIDLSPRMIELARREHTELSFAVGSLLDLPCAPGSLGGVVAWYSLVHTPASLLPAAFAEFYRVLQPGGLLLIAFKVGDQQKTLTNGYGHEIDLDVYEYPVELMTDLLAKAGFEEHVRMVRAPEAWDRQPQGYVLGVKPLGATNG